MDKNRTNYSFTLGDRVLVHGDSEDCSELIDKHEAVVLSQRGADVQLAVTVDNSIEFWWAWDYNLSLL